jgi:hypothetical protein
LAAETPVAVEPSVMLPRRPAPPSAHGVQIAFVAAGFFLLLVLVLGGAAAQVGVQQCAVCVGNSCGPAVEVCPASVFGLAIFAGLLVFPSLLIALGLSRWTIVWMGSLGTTPAQRSPPGPGDPGLDVMGTFLSFFGWALLAMGLLLPWDIFGYCRDGPCEYPYLLAGYPLLLAVVGGMTLATGSGLTVLLWIERRRSH